MGRGGNDRAGRTDFTDGAGADCISRPRRENFCWRRKSGAF